MVPGSDDVYIMRSQFIPLHVQQWFSH